MAKHFSFLILALSLSCSLMAAPYTIVIDAGHGGKDAGAVGHKGLLEKDLNLDISLRLASKIRTAFPETRVLLTRSSDEFIPLQGRADFVNKNNADLFICIHTNAAESRSAQGTEVFILGTEKMDQNLDVAMRENAVMKLEADYQTAYHGFDPNSIESYIMFELMQNNYMDQSLRFASAVQNEFVQALHREDRGVRQAAFWVLLKSACPSILVEMGFISNPDEEKYLASDHGKREITDALFHAFSNYYDPGQNKIQPQDSDSIALPSAVPENHAESASLTDAQQHGTIELTSPPVVSWRVQIFVSKTILPPSDHNFKGVKNCTYRLSNGVYKYMAGDFATREEAVQLRQQLLDKFPDSFVVKID